MLLFINLHHVRLVDMVVIVYIDMLCKHRLKFVILNRLARN